MPYGVKVLQCLKKLTTSLEIKLVNVMRVLLVRFKDFSGLVYYGFEMKKVSEIDRENLLSYSVRNMMARPVSQDGIVKIDQLAENLDSGGSGALTRNDLGNFLQRRCVGYGVNFLLR